MLDEIEASTGERPKRALADKGYLTEESLQAMEKRQQKCLIAVGREGKQAKWPRSPLTQRMHRTLRLPWAKELYRHRKTQGERPFAVIKGPMGFRRFMLRTKRKTRGEWDLVAAAFNLKALWKAEPA